MRFEFKRTEYKYEEVEATFDDQTLKCDAIELEPFERDGFEWTGNAILPDGRQLISWGLVYSIHNT
jgi:hypothetical protein